jgi:hypothetical protein
MEGETMTRGMTSTASTQVQGTESAQVQGMESTTSTTKHTSTRYGKCNKYKVKAQPNTSTKSATSTRYGRHNQIQDQIQVLRVQQVQGTEGTTKYKYKVCTSTRKVQ